MSTVTVPYYVRLDRLPTFDRWGDALVPLARGEFFTTTGNMLSDDPQFEGKPRT